MFKDGRAFAAAATAAVLVLLSGAAVADDLKAIENELASWQSVAEGDLNGLAAKEDVNLANVTALNSQFEGNTVGDNVSTGALSFNDQAFQNMNGIANLVSNTGANASINNSLVVNFILQ
jgi:hypothetical protein